MATPERLLRACLGGLIISLLLVGAVSGTPLRHLVQALPAIIVLALARRGLGWSPFAALSLFLFWLFIMSLIWLFLLGLLNIATGTYSLAERMLTVAIGLFCVIGLGAGLRVPRASGPIRRWVAFVAFAAIQAGAMWASLQPLFARR